VERLQQARNVSRSVAADSRTPNTEHRTPITGIAIAPLRSFFYASARRSAPVPEAQFMAALFWKKLLIRAGIARWLPSVGRRLGGATAFLNYCTDELLPAPHTELARAAQFLEMHEPDGIALALGAPRLDLLSGVRPQADRRAYPPSRGLPELRQVVAEKL